MPAFALFVPDVVAEISRQILPLLQIRVMI
jgi:hypothetical protein